MNEKSVFCKEIKKQEVQNLLQKINEHDEKILAQCCAVCSYSISIATLLENLLSYLIFIS